MLLKFPFNSFADAEISSEKLKESEVTLSAFAQLSFRLNASFAPSHSQMGVKGPSGSLPREDVRFRFDPSALEAVVRFVVKKEGRYQVVVRLPNGRKSTTGKEHAIKAESKTLAFLFFLDILIIVRER